MRNISETETEWFLKDLLEETDYLNNDDIIIEFKDATDSNKLKKLLATASKKGDGKNRGIPDFIVRNKRYPDVIFLIEVKPDYFKHESENRDRYKEYAVDGVLLYSSFVSKEFDVISIALSGTKERYQVSAFWQLKGTDEINDIKADKLLPYENYLRKILESEKAFDRDYSELLKYAKSLNTRLHNLKIKESNRALLISGVIIALQSRVFRESYGNYETSNALIQAMMGTISNELREDSRKDANTDTILGAFDFIRNARSFTNDKNGLITLIEVIDSIKNNVYTFLDKYNYIDTLSQFYIEFLRYANTDKGLGIVLTPEHIAELFAKMANVNKNTTVIDNTAGTGGFLVASLGQMMLDAGDDEDIVERIKNKQLIGIEFDSSILALLVSNMVIHSDGRSNIIWGDTFEEIPTRFKNKPVADVGLLNPPFKTSKGDREEFEFIFSNLEAVKAKGIVIALVPVSVVTATSGKNCEYKKELLKKHTLEAVVSLPEELFANSKTSVVTVGIVIKAHVPHPDNKETWLGYWRDDGFVKTKMYGRADINNVWAGEDGLESKWLDAFINKKEIPQFSIMKKLSADDEWIAEAYLEPDYEELTFDDFLKTTREYQAYKMENGL